MAPPAKGRALVRRVTHVNDPDFRAAAAFYRRRIPKDLQEEPDTMLGSDTDPDDYAYVAKLRECVCAFLLLRLCRKHRLAVIWYLVVDDKRPDAQHAQATRLLLKRAVADLAKDRGSAPPLLAEIEHPVYQKQKEAMAQRVSSRGKVRRFTELARGIHYRLALLEQVPYRQPDLSLACDPANERELTLVYGCPGDLTPALALPDCEKLLKCIYDCGYGRKYPENPAAAKRYREYIAGLRMRVMKKLRECWVAASP
jgi:hypothetical protein